MSKIDDYFVAGLAGVDRVSKWLSLVGEGVGEVVARISAYVLLVLLTPFVFINWLCGGSDADSND